MLEQIQAFRKTLHRYPELSGKEQATAARVREFIITHHNTTIIEGLGGNGLAAIYNFPDPGPVLMIRCELDALPIHETNQFEHSSQKKGVSHKCGHDGHMAIVAGLVFSIKASRFRRGKIILLFQPAEETGKGALAVLQDPKFKALEPDYIFALHNIPGVPLHTIVSVQHHFSCAVQSLAIALTGKVSHAAEPENGTNPAAAIAMIIQEFEELNIKELHRSNFALLTPIYIEMGEKAYGISAGSGAVHYTIRTKTQQAMEQLTSQIKQLVARLCSRHGLKYSIRWFDHFPAVVNDPHCNALITDAARKHKFSIKTTAKPFKFGEDFGWFSQNYKAAMFGIGAGMDTPALHHADYDFPDAIIPTGISMFTTLMESVLK